MTTELTPREREILRLRATGLRRKEIAHALGLSELTVRDHMVKAYLRLGVTSLVEALAALGWLKVPVQMIEDPDGSALIAWIEQEREMLTRRFGVAGTHLRLNGRDFVLLRSLRTSFGDDAPFFQDLRVLVDDHVMRPVVESRKPQLKGTLVYRSDSDKETYDV